LGPMRAPLAHRADLPQDQRAGWVEGATITEELGRLVRVKSPVPGIHSEVGDQAILGRDRRKHPCRVPLPAGLSDRGVRRVHEYAWVPIEGHADVQPTADLAQDRVDHRAVCLDAG
jgi:hypothetical protein